MEPIRSSKRRASRRRQPRPVLYRPRNYLLTKNEAAFFQILNAVVADCYQISCKVRLADIITCGDADWQRGQANRISQKHIDFVVNCADSSRIVAAIELDDASHKLPERRARDSFVNRLFWKIGVRLIRVPAQWEYDGDRITERLMRAGLFVRSGSDHIDRRPTGSRGHENERSFRWSSAVEQSPTVHSARRKRF